MSDCVVRMKMPKNCFNCILHCVGNFEDGNGYCRGISPYLDYDCRPSGEMRPSWCPIICQLPEGHGRLGDLDALTRLMLERKQPLVGADNSKDRHRYMQWLADFNAIKDAKTIVPAEKEGALNDDY